MFGWSDALTHELLVTLTNSMSPSYDELTLRGDNDLSLLEVQHEAAASAGASAWTGRFFYFSERCGKTAELTGSLAALCGASGTAGCCQAAYGFDGNEPIAARRPLPCLNQLFHHPGREYKDEQPDTCWENPAASSIFRWLFSSPGRETGAVMVS